MNNFLLKQSILRVLIVTAGCWIGAQWSLEVVLIIYMLQAYGFAFYNIYTLNRRSQWSVKDDIRIVFPALVASIVMVVVVEALKVSMPPLSPIISLALYVATGVAVYAGLHLLLFRKNSLRILNGARNILKKEVVPAPDVQQSPGF